MTLSSAPKNLAERRITGYFIPQVYVDEDHAIDLTATPFDATQTVLNLPLVKIQQLANSCMDPNEEDDLVPALTRDTHDGPFRVDYLDSAVIDFFQVDRGTNITQDMLDAARAAHRLDELKTYHVMVERTVTAHVWIEVQAKTEEGAASRAMSAAGDIDFNQASKSEPEYTAADIQEIGKNAPASRDRPKV